MRRFVFASVVFITGLAAGASTRLLVPAKQRVGITDQAAILSVFHPDLEGASNQADANVDGVWQRQINDTVFALKLPGTLYTALQDPEVGRTGWHGSFADDDARLHALEARLHAEPVPGCSFILVWFDGGPAADSPTIVNAVVRSHLTDAQRAARSALNTRIEQLSYAVKSLVRLEDDLQSEVDRTTDASKLQGLQSELGDAAERRRAMQHDFEKARARMFEPDLGGLRVSRWGRKPFEH